MGFIEGVGDEVVAFAVILAVFILAATVTFLLNRSPFTEHRQISPLPHETASSQSQEEQQPGDEDHTQDEENDTIADSNDIPSNISNDEETHITEESQVLDTNDETEVSSENTGNSKIYPDIQDATNIETEQSHVESEERQSTDPDEIHVRLKYLDDTERTVRSNPTVRIIDFKRTHFAEDIANNKVVRLIFSGQLLQDNVTLQSYGVVNNCVIHVQVLQAQTADQTFVSQNTDLDLSHLLWPLLSVILGICWLLYFKYPEFFNLMSLGMLFLFTGSLMYFYSQVR